MRLSFVNARIVDPASGHDGPGALVVEDGRVAGLLDGDPPAGGTVVDCAGKVLAPGLVDMRVFVGEPGARHRESLRTAGRAAAAGGVTTIVTQADTQPPIDDPALVQFVRSRAEAAAVPVRVRVMAALTKGLAGREMTEQQFLLDAGAVALSDADRPLADTGLMRTLMTYSTSTGALIVHHPQDAALSSKGSATSGEFATRLGLPSVPANSPEVAEPLADSAASCGWCTISAPVEVE
ncbi:MAG: hypothetical protein AAFV86_05175 [Pseudomonadota bacterium]